MTILVIDSILFALVVFLLIIFYSGASEIDLPSEDSVETFAGETLIPPAEDYPASNSRGAPGEYRLEIDDERLTMSVERLRSIERVEPSAESEPSPPEILEISDSPDSESSHSEDNPQDNGNAGNSSTDENARNRYAEDSESIRPALISSALDWLKRHQSPDGAWYAEGFHSLCGTDRDLQKVCANADGTADSGSSDADIGVTSLALLAFLGAGNTITHGQYRGVVRSALRFILQNQQGDGFVGKLSGLEIWNQALAAMALSEAYAMTGVGRLAEPAQRAVDYLVRFKLLNSGWGETSSDAEANSFNTGWVIIALKSAKIAGLNAPQSCFDDGVAFIEDVTDSTTGIARWSVSNMIDPRGRFSNQTTTAAALISKLFCRVPRSNSENEAAADFIVSSFQSLDSAESSDFTGWYLSDLALFQMGSRWWDDYAEAFQPMAFDFIRDEPESCAAGSYDPAYGFSTIGGRVYTTAALTMALEVYRRYEPIRSRRDE
ncbi:MAG: terpene cyclase/mutase family protein [Planctomycetes bacterium]|nr:terpene cyclase/mutase family protein [Planctomycetota bacterium]